jgi:hypothetical protein
MTKCPFAPDGARSDGTSTIVNTPENAARFGCPTTSGIATAILFKSIISMRPSPHFVIQNEAIACANGASNCVVEGSLRSLL